MTSVRYLFGVTTGLLALTMITSLSAYDTTLGTRDEDRDRGSRQDGRHLFDKETFGGNGRTCLTCHSRDTGTVSPEDARLRFRIDRRDPLFLADGSDDGNGHGTSRMRTDATVLVTIPLPDNVTLADDPAARSVTLRRGIPSTLNTPGLDPVLMMDGRQPNLEQQALGALHDHAAALGGPTGRQLDRLVEFEKTDDRFFSSPMLQMYARGKAVPALPPGRTDSEIRGRRFFDDVLDVTDLKHGACATCHAGPMLNETNVALQALIGVPQGTRFQGILVSEFNAAQNPVHDYVFTNPDGTQSHVVSPDPGRALISGIGQETGRFDNVNAFKIPSLWGVAKTAPYFHDNSAKTLADVVAHYRNFFLLTSDLDGPGPMPPFIDLTPQDEADIVAYMKLLK